MKRLTKRDEFDNADIIGVYSKTLYDGLDDIEFNTVTEALNKLAEYEDLEEQGLLLKLPYKIGNPIYRVVDIVDRQSCYGCDGCTDEFLGKDTKCDYLGEDGYSCTNAIDDKKNRYSIIRKSMRYEYIPMVNRTVFLTREEAEKKLKEMEEMHSWNTLTFTQETTSY